MLRMLEGGARRLNALVSEMMVLAVEEQGKREVSKEMVEVWLLGDPLSLSLSK